MISTLTAAIVFAFLKKPGPNRPSRARNRKAWRTTFRGYGVVLRDTTFMLFMFACLLMGLVYMNMNTTLRRVSPRCPPVRKAATARC